MSSTVSWPYTMPEAAAAVAAADFPEWVLLDMMGHIGPCDDNATTATGETSAGQPFKLSFVIAEPPLLSRFFVHFPNMSSVDSKVSAFVTGADANFLLIRLAYPDPAGSWRIDSDVFIYSVAAPAPSLYLVPSPNLTGLRSDHVAILSCDDAVTGKKGTDCLLVIPKRRFDADGGMWYQLHIFSTKTKLWSTRDAEVTGDLQGYYKCWFQLTKVFSLGEGLLAWVDLRYGILLCDVLVEKPIMSLLKLDPLMGSNKDIFAPNFDGILPPVDQIRDVTFKDGCFRFIEIEYLELDDNVMDLCWRATMFTRAIEAQNWEHYCTCDSAELSPADSCPPLCFPEIMDYKQEKPTLNKTLTSSTPTLDMYNDNVVYMIYKLKASDLDGWVLAINTLSNEVEKAEPFANEKEYFNRTILQSAFSNWLRKAPGTHAAKVVKNNRHRFYSTLWKALEAYLQSALVKLQKIEIHMASLRNVILRCMSLLSSGQKSSSDPNAPTEATDSLNRGTSSSSDFLFDDTTWSSSRVKIEMVDISLRDAFKELRKIEIHMDSLNQISYESLSLPLSCEKTSSDPNAPTEATDGLNWGASSSSDILGAAAPCSWKKIGLLETYLQVQGALMQLRKIEIHMDSLKQIRYESMSLLCSGQKSSSDPNAPTEATDGLNSGASSSIYSLCAAAACSILMKASFRESVEEMKSNIIVAWAGYRNLADIESTMILK
ncbi:hypothetical protein EJB05_22121 [Eragrostis curvula]|uniref:DUF1618 domain-containing protein n=1 Tax=Eragrostis curvula TaxID=38414 RepID=A0A5J9V4N8_9POAL|nr:hypothetical protein EJB05_22121 [Eragrostis curvula]